MTFPQRETQHVKLRALLCRVRSWRALEGVGLGRTHCAPLSLALALLGVAEQFWVSARVGDSKMQATVMRSSGSGSRRKCLLPGHSLQRVTHDSVSLTALHQEKQFSYLDSTCVKCTNHCSPCHPRSCTHDTRKESVQMCTGGYIMPETLLVTDIAVSS